MVSQPFNVWAKSEEMLMLAGGGEPAAVTLRDAVSAMPRSKAETTNKISAPVRAQAQLAPYCDLTVCKSMFEPSGGESAIKLIVL